MTTKSLLYKKWYEKQKCAQGVHKYNFENSHLSINAIRIFYCARNGCDFHEVVQPEEIKDFITKHKIIL